MSRIVTVYTSNGQNAKSISINATDWGTLQGELNENDIPTSGLKAILGEQRTTLESNAAQLPLEDFSLFLMPKKTKSGIDYSTLSFKEKRAEMKKIFAKNESAKEYFKDGSKNWTQLSSDKITELLTSWHNGEKTSTKKEEKKVEKKPKKESKKKIEPKVEKKVEKKIEKTPKKENTGNIVKSIVDSKQEFKYIVLVTDAEVKLNSKESEDLKSIDRLVKDLNSQIEIRLVAEKAAELAKKEEEKAEEKRKIEEKKKKDEEKKKSNLLKAEAMKIAKELRREFNDIS